MKTKKIYNPPITEMVEVEFEGGFMADSVYPEPENTEALEIKDQQVDPNSTNFDFSNKNQWEQ